MIYLIYLDDDHLEDPLFLQSMAQLMHHRHTLPPMLMMHGSGGQAERLLDAEGLFPEQENGVIVATTPEEAALVERGYRQATRRVVGTMIEEIIYAVGFQGSDRGLLRRGAGGTVEVHRIDWIMDLVQKGAIPVISAWVRDSETDQEAPARLQEVIVAIAKALEEEEVIGVFFTKGGAPGVFESGEPVAECTVADLEADVVSDMAAVQALVDAGVPLFLTSPVGFFGGTGVLGTEILP